MFINGVIFQVHWVNFEIKKEQMSAPLISEYLFKWYIFPKALC
jgi:hypothetical protein